MKHSPLLTERRNRRLVSHLKKRHSKIPMTYNPDGTGLRFTALMPTSISAVDNFSNSRAWICWFLAVCSDEGTLPSLPFILQVLKRSRQAKADNTSASELDYGLCKVVFLTEV